MSGILFLAHRMPFPPDRGDKIRSHHVLRALADVARVHVGCFADSAADMVHKPTLEAVATTSFVPLRAKPLVTAGAEAVLRREPASVAAYRDARLARWVRDTLATHEIDTIYVFSGQMGQYVPAGWAGRVVVDLVDVDSAKFDAYGARSGFAAAIYRREGRLLAREEARLADRADYTLLVSDAEAALLRSRIGALEGIATLGNEIDAAAFDPAAVEPQPELEQTPGPHLVFTGQMDYAPNIAAARRLIAELLPVIRGCFPDAQADIVGRAPPASLAQHDGISGVRVWGEVPDVRPFLKSADLVIAPLEIARGIQNKVLEAMAMAKPVVLTSQAATGIAAQDGVHFAVDDSNVALAARALALLADPAAAAAMGAAARTFVCDRMSWPAMLARLPEFVGRPSATARRHAA